jgi:hypothetical protein
MSVVLTLVLTCQHPTLPAKLANNLGVGDFSVVVGWDLVIGNGEEGVGAFDVLAFVGMGADALA